MNKDTIAFYYRLITFCYNTPDRWGDADAHYINSVLYTLHLILLYWYKVNISRKLAFALYGFLIGDAPPPRPYHLQDVFHSSSRIFFIFFVTCVDFAVKIW